MPLKILSNNGKCYVKWGDKGHPYEYKCGNAKQRAEAKKKALAQAVAKT